MENLKKRNGNFDKTIKKAINMLRKYELEEAHQVILHALSEDANAPEPHNLLGLWYEFKGNYDLARKHYRAAYALDPTYKPASVNLERVCTMFINKRIPFDYGEVTQEEQKTESVKGVNKSIQ